MNIRKLASITLALMLLSISFSMMASESADAAFIVPLSNNGLSSTFVVEDTTWNEAGTIAVVVGYDTNPLLPNAYTYHFLNDTYVPIDNGGFNTQRLYSVDHYGEPVYGWGNGTRRAGDGASVNMEETPPTLNEAPGPQEGTTSITMVSQDFSSTTYPPVGWVRQNVAGTSWNRYMGNLAGGTVPETYFYPGTASTFGTSRFYTGPIDTTSITSLTLQWRNAIWDRVGFTGVNCSIKTSTDLVTWHDTDWYWDDTKTPASMPASQININVNTVDVGSPTFYISWTITGDAYGLSYWFFDDIVLTGPSPWFYDMEGDVSDWTNQDMGVTGATPWHLTTTQSYSPIHSWWCAYEANGTYANGTLRINTTLWTPTLDMSSYTSGSAVLSFYEKYITEAGWDRVNIAYSTDNGATTAGFLRFGVTGTSSGHPAWIRSTFSIPGPYTNQMKIGFHFDTQDGGVNNLEGWFVDDVYIGPPTILQTSPADAQVNVPVNSPITVTFSNPMSQALISYTCSPDPGGWSVAWNAESTIVTFTHATNFALATTYTFRITGGMDSFGNPLSPGLVPNPWKFLTPETVQPTITAKTPATGATGVGITQSILITFSEAMNTGSVAFTCSPNPGGWISYWNSPTNTQLTLTHTAFAYLTTYTFTVTTALDVSGNPLNPTPYAWSFTTIAGASATATGPISVTPTNIGSVTITYSRTGANPTSVNLYYTTNGGTTWTLAGNDASWSDGAYAWTCPSAGTYGWIAQAVGGGSTELSPPTPGTVPEATSYIYDTTSPTLFYRYPGVGGTNIAINQDIRLIFTETMNTGSLTYTCSPDPGGWGSSWSMWDYTNDQVYLSHTAFAYGTTYTFTITGATDIAGNLLATPISWSFTTVAAATVTATGPISATPTNVGSVTLTYTYSGATPTSVNLYYTTNGGTSWTLAGNDATVDGSFPWTVPASGTYGWIAQAVGGGSTEASPPAPGTPPEASSYVYDETNPTISYTIPSNGQTGVAITQSVIIRFSESMDPGSFTYTCSPDPGGWGITWTSITYTNDRIVLSHTAFSYFTTYTFTINSITDVAGNSISPIPYSWSFTTTGATATATGPTGGPTNDVTVTLTYNYIDSPTSVNLYYTKSTVSPWTWVLAGNDATVDGSFAYTITAGSGSYRWLASAVGGNSVEPSPPPSTTGPESGTYILDLDNPTITATNPADAETDVLPTQDIVVTFSEAVNPASLVFTCNPDPGGWGVTWSGGNTVATMMHAAFAYSTTYTFTVTGALDVAGNLLIASAVPNPWTFTTIAVASATATGPTGTSNVNNIQINYVYTGAPTSVNIYYTIDGGTNWILAGNDATVDGSFTWTVPAQGTYGWIVQAVGGGTSESSPPIAGTPPEASPYIYETVSPTITGTSPANGVTSVGLTTNVVITFSESMNIGSVTYTCSPDPGGWAASWNGPTNTVLTLSHTAFAFYTVYTFTVTAATDVAGNALVAGVAPNPWSFRTIGATATATGPTGTSNDVDVIITYSWTDSPTSINLYYTKSTVSPYTWVLAGNDATLDGSFAYTITAGEGYYRWLASAVGGNSVEPSPPGSTVAPETTYYVLDLTPPAPPTDLTVTWTSGPLINEGFTSISFPPNKWVQAGPSNQWSRTGTSSAGGTLGEAHFQWISATSDWRFYTGPFDTTGMASLDLQFRQFFDDFGPGVTVKVQTSSDLMTWNDIGWFVNSGAGNVGPNLVSWTINTADVGSSSFYISWTVTGNAYYMDYWCIDDVLLTYPSPGATDHNQLDWTLSADDGAGSNDVHHYNIYRANSEFGAYSLIDSVSAGTASYFDYMKGEPDGINWWYIVRAVDVAGNEEMNTDAVPEDPIPPTIISTIPSNGFIGSAINQNIVVTFSEEMNPSSLTYTCSPNPGGWSAMWSTVTFPNDRVILSHTNFAYGTTYTFTVTAAADLAGNPLAASALPNPFSFTTVAAASATATGPTGGPTNVAGVTITYSRTGFPTSVNLYYTLNGGTTWNYAGNDASVDGSYAWSCPTAGTYGWIAQAVGGGSTEPSPPAGGTPPESTSYIYDNVNPFIVTNNPVSGASGVSIAQSIVITFNEPMNTGSITYTCSPNPGGWSASWNGPTNTILTLTHANFQYGTTYTFTVTGASDVAGNSLVGGGIPNPWSFTTVAAASATATGPISATPTNTAGITVTYTYTGIPTSVEIYYTTTDGVSWSLWGIDNTVDGSYAITLSTSGTYGWLVQAVGGGSTEPIPPTLGSLPEATPYVFDNVSPTIISTSPISGATGVGVTQSIVITFSESMGSASYSLNPSTAYSSVWATLNYPNDQLILTPTTEWTYSTTYTVTVGISADVAGNLLVASALPNPWSFTTIPAATATATGPTGGPTNVASITLTYTYTGTPTSVNLYFTTDAGSSWILAGNDATVDGSFAWVIPYSWGTFAWYASAVGGGSIEPSPPAPGTPPEVGSYVYDGVPPTITLTDPASGTINIPVTQSIAITFSEVIDGATLGFTCSPDPGGWGGSWSGNTITLTHAAFLHETTYTFTITTASDMAGNSLFGGPAQNPWSFTTSAGATATATGPTGGPANLAAISVTYTWTGTPTSVLVYYSTDASNWVLWGEDISMDGFYDITLISSGNYSWIVQAVGDGSTELPPTIGTSPEAGAYIFDNNPPFVTAVSPGVDATEVPGNAPIIVDFSEPVNIGSGTVNLIPNPGGISIFWSNGDTRLILNHDDFDEGITVTVEVLWFEDAAGNIMAFSQTWSFTISEMSIIGYRDVFWICGDRTGGPPATVYKYTPHTGNQLIPMNDGLISFQALALDNIGNPLCAGSSLQYMYYYDGIGWNLIPDDMSALSGYGFESMTFNPNDGRFYAGSYFNIFYTDPVPFTVTSKCHMFSNFNGNGDDITSIAWNELYDYGLVAEGPEVIKIWPFGYYGDGSLRYETVPGHTTGSWYRDISWDTDGWNEVGIVGNKGGNRAYWRYYHSNPQLIEGYVGSPGNYLACAMKPPCSPKWLFVPSPDESIRVNIMEKDESDRVIFSVDKPHIFEMDMWKQTDIMRASVLGSSLEANSTYTFFIEGNYTRGGIDYWDSFNVQLNLMGWYDYGQIGTLSVPGDAGWASLDHRTRQFQLTYSPGNLPVMSYPFGSPGEFSVHSYHEVAGYGPDGASRRVYINVTIGEQAMFSSGSLAGATVYPYHQNTALNDQNTWDLNVTLRDAIDPTIGNSTYEEFCIKKYASISSWGSPTGNVPPGAISAPLSSPSYISYSINAPYTLNVSIPNLYREGNPALNFIPANMVEAMNAHPNADPTNSDMALTSTNFMGPNNDLCIWGKVSGTYTVPEPGNGDISAGPGYTDYTNPVFTVTSVVWAVTVDAGTQEGTYRGTITITLWSG